ncbi:cysteine dioxygenase [Brevibacillus sp. SYSU BS000544]|uniref:cysteine dioxygenase n=1 Tax=Brevibacillus sp. SYSU BS000544 TaxID=3416443 RepID=UPI003CE480F6
MNLIDKLETHFGNLQNPTEADITKALRELKVSTEEISPFITEPTNLPYGRNFIYQDRNVEIVIINLPSACCSMPHDHGNSDAYERIIDGELTHSVFHTMDGGKIQLSSEKVYTKDEICQVPKGHIHSIKNNSLYRTVILNVYSPPITKQKLYPFASDRIACSKEATQGETE